MGITQSEWEELRSEAADLLREKQTHVSVSPVQGYLLQEDLQNSRTFHSVLIPSPSFLSRADPCLGLFSQRLIAFLWKKS